MSSGSVSRHRSSSARSSSASTQSRRANHAHRLEAPVRHTPPPTSITPETRDHVLEPCAATASFLLYAQRNTVLVLHHDTLAIERRFALHREDVIWIAVDNTSERGCGRLAVSFDTGRTAIVWDILSGAEVARFSAYEHIKVASFMRNGNIAFGNDQGNIILFEPSTSEHVSSRTIFDPITAIAPAADCRTFAVGYLNGSILIVTLQPSFTIIHTLNTNRAPSKIIGLAWHGSSSKQKTDMLATQTQDGDLRVWSVPKGQHTEAPTVIRILQRPETTQQGPCWFAWSKNGRLIQLADGETRAWDVRTKKVTYDIIPTIEGVVGVTNYGPTATLFTLGRNHTVQQYDINPSTAPLQVATVQHAPANTPPTPPTALDEGIKNIVDARSNSAPVFAPTEDSSADESGGLSPLQKIAREMESLDALESEIRDKVMPLSPTSYGSVSSRSSGKPPRRQRRYLYDRPDSSRAPTASSGYEGTEFSSGLPSRIGHESMSSMQSSSSLASVARHRYSNLRREILRSPDEAKDGSLLDLFPCTRARLREVPFRTPHYGDVARTPDLLRREMISVVFGWHDDIQSLIREELSRQRAGSASGVLLLQWLGDIGADNMASLVGSESMTSSDWMLLALSSIGSDSKKKVGEAFVQRLLEKGDVHAAVAILIGLNETNDAIEVYLSQQYCMEAVLLTALVFPSDWGRISNLLRRWGEHAVMNGEAELAVRCFSCTSIETSAPWTSPRAQEAVYAAQQERMTRPPSAGIIASPTLSNPSRSGSGRMTAKNASLKLITNFDNKAITGNSTADPLTTIDAATAGVTPILNSALPMSPGGHDPWRQRIGRRARDPSSARTATPGGLAKRTRLPSRDQIERAKQEAAEMATPITAARDTSDLATPGAPLHTSENRSSNAQRTASFGSFGEPTTAVKPTSNDFDRLAVRTPDIQDAHLPSPARGAFSRQRQSSRQRNPEHLAVQIHETVYTDQPSPDVHGNVMSPGGVFQSGTLSPPLTGGSGKASTKSRANEEYINSVEEARRTAKYKRAESRTRGDSRKRTASRSGRASSRKRESSESRAKGQVWHIKPGKRSPSSPIPMSPEEIAKATQSQQVEPATTDDENYYKIGIQSPVESHGGGRSASFRERTSSRQGRAPRGLSADRREDDRGRSELRTATSVTRSPSSPLPLLTNKKFNGLEDAVEKDGRGFPPRSSSASRWARDDLQSRRLASRDRREPCVNRQPTPREGKVAKASDTVETIREGQVSQSSAPIGSTGQPRGMSRKELAAKELEERRQSLARRPSAPAIPLPGEAAAGPSGSSLLRPAMAPRSQTDLGDSPTSYMPPVSRTQTVDPDTMFKGQTQNQISGVSTPSAPIGLPATPRAMRHPRYMSHDPAEREGMPPVPDIPGKFSDMGSLSGSSLSQVTDSNLSQVSSSLVSSEQQQKSSLWSSDNTRSLMSEASDSIGPLLPSTVFSQPGSQGSNGRSVSAPPQDNSPIHPLYRSGLSSNRRLSNVRKISPPDANAADGAESIVASIDAALHYSNESQVIIVPDQTETNPPMLPELRHLAMPPPPPPPPLRIPERTGLGVINIAVDEKSPSSALDRQGSPLPQPMERASTASPYHRRNAPSGSGDSFGARIRGIGDRMRSGSKSRTKSPTTPADYKPSPYESVLPPFVAGHHRNGSLPQTQRAQSPYEQAMAAQSKDQNPTNPAGPTSPSSDMRLNGMNIPPSSLPGSRSGSATGGYRNPKDIRANMPPTYMQHGTDPTANGFL